MLVVMRQYFFVPVQKDPKWYDRHSSCKIHAKAKNKWIKRYQATYTVDTLHERGTHRKTIEKEDLNVARLCLFNFGLHLQEG